MTSNDNDHTADLPDLKDFFKLLFDEVPCYISVQDRDLKIVQSNRRFKEDFGEVTGAKCHEIYKHSDEPCLYCPVAETFKNGKSHQSEELVISRDGERINTLVSTAPIVGSTGEIALVIEMSTNITKVRDLEERLTNIGMLVGSISHGLRGLLMGLDGGTYLLNTGLEKNKQNRVEEGARMIRRNVDRIRGVVLDMLDIARESEPELEPAPLQDLARSIAQRLEKRALDLNIDFRVEIDDAVGICEIDRRSLRKSVVNILENAFEACRVNGREESHFVRFSLSSDGDNAVFDIEDNGIGMDRKTVEHMFSLAFSPKGSKATNLGLFTANKVVEKHRGIIEVESTPRKGTTYTIRIPKIQNTQ